VLDELRAAAPDLLVLPDEPYAFTAADGPEAFPGVPYALVSGRISPGTDRPSRKRATS